MKARSQLRVGVIGAGRIGAIHARNLAAHDRATLAWIVDPRIDAARRLAAQLGAASGRHAEDALAADDVDAVIIAAPSSTHADLVEAAIAAGKPTLCEKPLDLSLDRARSCAAAASASGVPVMVGFNRRFDPGHAALIRRLREGEIGAPEIVSITSRDPEPPPADYLAGAPSALFRETTIHDFDMARALLGEEPVAVAVMAGAHTAPHVAALGEVDTAVIMLRTASGRLAQINNSWRAVYGYDQRVEVLGAKGLLRSENLRRDGVIAEGAEGSRSAPNLYFFLDRYRESYRVELDAFLGMARGETPPPVTVEDGWRASALAEAAVEAVATGRVVALDPA